MDDAARLIRYPHDQAPDHGTATEVAEGVLWIRLPLPMALDHVNVYALDDGAGWTVIDTGIASRKSRGIWETMLSGPLNGKPVTRVLVTHHHPDHIGLAGWFQSHYRAELWTARTAWLMARMLSLDVEDRPSEAAIAHWKSAGMPTDILEQRRDERPFNFADTIAPLPMGYTRISEGEKLQIGGRTWVVHMGNGHAPEHATLWSESDNLIIGGDQLLPSISPNLGVYPTEPNADPVGDWLDSCTRFQAMARDDHFVLPGHKLPFVGLPTRIDQLIDNHISALSRLHDALATPATAVESFVPIFKRDIRGDQFGLAMVEAVAHCQHLWHQGRASRTRRDDGAWVYTAL